MWREGYNLQQVSQYAYESFFFLVSEGFCWYWLSWVVPDSKVSKDTSDLRHFGTGAEVSGHFSTGAEMSVRHFGTEVSLV